MIRLKSLLTETVVKDPNFISYIKSVEGLGKGSTEKKHVAYYDTVGKVWTIGYGHTGNVKSSMTWPAAVAEQYLIDDLMKAETIVLDFVKRNYPTFKLGTTQTQMLTDFAFNLGGLGKFPTFTKAVVTKNWKVAAQEYKRYGDGKELTNRNEQFYKTFLAPLLASQSSKSKQTNNINKSVTHIVKSGDTLSALAAKYKITVQQLKQINGLTSDNIKIGQKLYVQLTKPTSNKKKDRWGRPSTSKWYGFDPQTKKYSNTTTPNKKSNTTTPKQTIKDNPWDDMF